jgi:hypothetical protein
VLDFGIAAFLQQPLRMRRIAAGRRAALGDETSRYPVFLQPVQDGTRGNSSGSRAGYLVRPHEDETEDIDHPPYPPEDRHNRVAP